MTVQSVFEESLSKLSDQMVAMVTIFFGLAWYLVSGVW